MRGREQVALCETRLRKIPNGAISELSLNSGSFAAAPEWASRSAILHSGFPDHFLRVLVAPEPHECRMPQAFVWCPLREFDLGYCDRIHPSAGFHLFPRHSLPERTQAAIRQIRKGTIQHRQMHDAVVNLSAQCGVKPPRTAPANRSSLPLWNPTRRASSPR